MGGPRWGLGGRSSRALGPSSRTTGASSGVVGGLVATLVCAALVVVCLSACGGGHTAEPRSTTPSRHLQPTSAGATSATPPSATPQPTCTTVPDAIGPVPGWLPPEFPLPSGTTFVGEQSDGAGGRIGLFSAPSADPAGYYASVTGRLLGAGWAVTSWPETGGYLGLEGFGPPDDRGGSFAKPPLSLGLGVNTYTYCGGAARISVDLVG